MKYLFLESRAKNLLPFPEKQKQKLPKSLTIVAPVQFLDFAENLKKELEKKGHNVYLPGMKHANYNGQILGCSLNKINNDSSAILFIGIGNFHPLALINNDKKLFIYNPFNQKLSEADYESIKKQYKKRNKIIISKFITSTKIGVIISLKYGQFYKDFEQKINLLKQKYPEKKFYFFIFDTVNLNEFENFNFIEFIINTSCPRLGIDDFESSPKTMANLDSLLELLGV